MNHQGLHEDSQKSYKELDKSSERLKVHQVFTSYEKPLTDREVAAILNAKDMDEVRPRISELKDMGLIIELKEKVRCVTPGKTVRVCQVAHRAPAFILEPKSKQYAMSL